MRLVDQPAFVLHRRAFSESSQIVELLTRDHGRIAALAKGSRRGAHNKLRAEPFQPLRVDLRGTGELPLLVRIETEPGTVPVLLKSTASLAGLYLNELLMVLLQREDPHPDLFDHYAACLAALAGELAWPLRRFEWALLTALGYAPDLEYDARGVEVDATRRYRFSPDQGLHPTPDGALSGAMLRALKAGERAHLEGQRRFLREQLALHMDHHPLRSWQLLGELDQVLPRTD